MLRNTKLNLFIWGVTALLVLLVFGIQYSSNVLSLYEVEGISFKRDGTKWQSNEFQIGDGTYYVSVGRPRAICDLMINREKIGSTVSSVPMIRGSLLLGGSFVGKKDTPYKIDIECVPEEGFGISLMHPPMVMPYYSGVLLQLWRATTELALGPLFSFLLLLTLCVSWVSGSTVTRNGVLPHLCFASIALIYSISLSYYTRLFMDGFYASVIHAILRMSFTISFLLVIGHYLGHIKPILVACACALLAEVIVGFAFNEYLDFVDKVFYIVLPLSTLAYFIAASKKENLTRTIILLKIVLATRLCIQAIDFMIVWFNVGVYLAPTSLALMTTLIMVLKAKDDKLREKNFRISEEIVQQINSRKHVRDIISDLARIIFRETSFTRFSAYIDSFSIGKSDRPHESMTRIDEHGYRKVTESDQLVKFKDNRGSKMKTAIDEGQVKFDRGEINRAHFINVPLGKHAVINVSNDEAKADYKAHESFEILKNLHMVLSTVDDKLVDYGFKQTSALQKLRARRGDGTWQEEIGVIFVDVNEYSTLSERYGNAFSEFISAKYLPALCKVVGSWAVRESSRGDEVYLVSIQDMIESELSPKDAVLRSIDAIIAFARNEGVTLCKNAGFVPVTMSVGAGLGMGSVVCDAHEVRTTGEMINETHRLLSSAPQGAIVLHADLVSKIDRNDTRYAGQDTPVLVKKNFIMARTLKEKISA